MTDPKAPPVPTAEPIPPTLPERYEPPAGTEPVVIEADSLEAAALEHARGPVAPDPKNFGNVIDGAPHFVRLLDGQDPADAVCGQDGKPWPCPDALRIQGDMIETPNRIDQAGNLPTISVEAAARAAGVTPDEFRSLLIEQGRRGYGG